jgi:prepilin-type N-terminal cleavage/methylation domain-containing protein
MKPKNPTQFSRPAFTLIELLVVISIIALLSGLVIAGLGAAKKSANRSTAKANLAFVAAAIESYKDKYNTYPPSNTNSVMLNPLYYELSGVTLSGSTYTTLDGAAKITEADYKTAFGIGGILNVTRGGGDDGVAAKNFLPGLDSKLVNDNVSNNLVRTTILVTSVGGPDVNYQPLGARDLNPFHYNSFNPTNNPGGYDLWLELHIGGKTNIFGNWTAK